MKKLIAILILPLPSFLKVLLMRHLLGYQIGRGVRIGLSLVMTEQAEIGDRVRIGHFNLIARMKHLKLGSDCTIGFANIILGGLSVRLGDGARIGRLNEINSILDPLVRGTPDPVLILGDRAIVTAWHKIDFTDRVELGDSVVFAGRHSNIWTHNRQDVGPVTIGPNCYVGSGIQMVPGSGVGASCVVGLGAVITRRFTDEFVLLAGVPARVVKPLDEDGRRMVQFPTRPDLDGYGNLSKEVSP
jgi:acetyltransferase-like isoleucine patch superfamily enzyme